MFEASSARRRLKEALSLLEDERRLLLRGDIVGLLKFDRRRARLMDRLPEITGDALKTNEALVESVRRMARRNATLLQAFLDGIQAAQARLQEISQSRHALGLYREDGSRIENDGQNHGTSRRL